MDVEPRGEPPLVRCLSFHGNYKCRNTGICCSSAWEIAVETDVEVRLSAVIAQDPRHLPNGPNGFRPMADPPTGCTSALRRVDSTGSCWFRDEPARACAIHRNFGLETLPSACRHFPRVCLLEPGVVSVSLSHYCPTAATLLFDDSKDFELVAGPPAFPSDWPFEGLDVRGAYPPFLRPGVLLGFDGLRAFEDRAVAVLSREPLWEALATIEAAVESARAWTVGAGPLCELVADSFLYPRRDSGDERRVADPRGILLAALTEMTTPMVGLPDFRPGPPAVSSMVDLALRKYLASRLIAAWITFQGDDLRSVVRYLRLCLDTVFLFESARGPEESDAVRWKEAVRHADLWILHYCDPDRLVRNLR